MQETVPRMIDCTINVFKQARRAHQVGSSKGLGPASSGVARPLAQVPAMAAPSLDGYKKKAREASEITLRSSGCALKLSEVHVRTVGP